MALNNGWVRYIDRTYQQIKDRVLTQLQSLVPEITDHTESNPYVKIIGIWGGMTEHLNYYIDNAAREVFLSTARRYESAVKIASMFDYRLRGIKFASVDVIFRLNQVATVDILIPAGFKISTADGIEFTTVVSTVILAGDISVNINCEQKVTLTEPFIFPSTGSSNQIYTLADNVVDRSVTVTIANANWLFVETFAFSQPDSKHFTTSVNTDGNIYVKFGDGLHGAIPTAGQNISIDYTTSSGSIGILAESSITTVVSPISLPIGVTLSVENLSRSSGGADLETLENLKKRIPLSIRTLGRAVTEQDYEDIAVLQPGVKAAGISFNCGKTVIVYIVPEGGGVATQSLLDDVRDAYYDKTRMITTEVLILPAGEIKVTLNIKLRVLPAFGRLATEALVKSNLEKYINETNREVGGSLYIGNLYEIIEGTEGVSFCEIELLTAQPYARIIAGTVPLIWTIQRVAKVADSTVWQAKFSASGEFTLTKNGDYAGTYTAGEAINKEEISFTIADEGTYSDGDTWEFVVYPSDASIELNEPSVFALYDNNLIINSDGGI